MIALEKRAATAAHWSAQQYEALFGGHSPERLVLIIEDELGLEGFVIARVVHRDWEIENIAVAGPAVAAGWARACWESCSTWPEVEAPTQYFSKSANPTTPPGRSMRNGHSSRAGAAADITKTRTRFCIALASFSLQLISSCTSSGAELFTMKNHSSVENGIEAVGSVW
jgi:hypothetical protein